MKVMGPFVAAIVLLFPLPSLAHGGGLHLMGTVKSVEASSITIKTTQKKDVTVSVDEQTKFEKSGAPATIKDVTAGERVVVHTAKPDRPGALKAVMVKFGAPQAPAVPRPAHDHHADSPPGAKKR
jgi:Domain of unknown function (DUF5666)